MNGQTRKVWGQFWISWTWTLTGAKTFGAVNVCLGPCWLVVFSIFVFVNEHQNGFRRRSEDVDVLLPLLQRLHTVRNLPYAAQRALCAVARVVKYQQGEYIYRKDDLSDSSYLVLTGKRCRSWQKARNGGIRAVIFRPKSAHSFSRGSCGRHHVALCLSVSCL